MARIHFRLYLTVSFLGCLFITNAYAYFEPGFQNYLLSIAGHITFLFFSFLLLFYRKFIKQIISVSRFFKKKFLENKKK